MSSEIYVCFSTSWNVSSPWSCLAVAISTQILPLLWHHVTMGYYGVLLILFIVLGVSPPLLSTFLCHTLLFSLPFDSPQWYLIGVFGQLGLVVCEGLCLFCFLLCFYCFISQFFQIIKHILTAGVSAPFIINAGRVSMDLTAKGIC